MRDPSIRRVTAATASAQSEVVVVAGRFVARRIVWRTSVAHRWSTWRPSGPVSVGASRGPLDRGIDLGRHVEPEPQRDGHVDGGVPGVRASTDVVVGAVADHHYFPVRACGGGCGRTKRAARATTWRLTTGPRRRSRRTSPPAASRTGGRRRSRPSPHRGAAVLRPGWRSAVSLVRRGRARRDRIPPPCRSSPSERTNRTRGACRERGCLR